MICFSSIAAMSIINLFVIPSTGEWYKQNEIRHQDLPPESITVVVHDYWSENMIDNHVAKILQSHAGGRDG